MTLVQDPSPTRLPGIYNMTPNHRSALQLLAAVTLCAVLVAFPLHYYENYLEPVLTDAELDTETDHDANLKMSTVRLQRTVDCWALQGKWTYEPASFFGRRWGERWEHSSLGDCHPNMTIRDRNIELTYQWVPPTTCASDSESATTPSPVPSATGRNSSSSTAVYLRGGELGAALLDRVLCLTLLAVGDSLSEAMMHTMLDYVRTVEALNARRPNRVSVRFIRNDHVAVEGEEINEPQTRKQVWRHLLQNQTFSAILLNRGAHYVPSDRLLREYRTTLEYVRATNPNAFVLVRTTPSGHWNCSLFANAPPLTTPLPPAPPESTFYKFNWDAFQIQNALLRQMIETDPHLKSHVIVMDVAPATNLRADSHRTAFGDCLHYCMPGPMDMWVELYGNILLRMQDIGLLPRCNGTSESST